MLLDESGEPAAQEVAGRITASWRSGSKKANWTASEPLKLPIAKVLPLLLLLAGWPSVSAIG